VMLQGLAIARRKRKQQQQGRQDSMAITAEGVHGTNDPL